VHFCPPGIVEKNPCIDYIKHIVFQRMDSFTVDRKHENGGPRVYNSFEELVEDYKGEKLHPADLKPALSKAINELIAPVRKHFETDPKAKELLKKVKEYKATR